MHPRVTWSDHWWAIGVFSKRSMLVEEHWLNTDAIRCTRFSLTDTGKVYPASILEMMERCIETLEQFL